jgi:chromosome segregation ATPase
MLKRLIVLNSTTYGKAVVKLDDCDSIQLVGPNNIGKSTFIYALNFLFIIDGKKMAFVDNKPGDKETVHHYFPSSVNSYIVFEIFKQSYYCILLKRNSEGEIEYYRFDREYSDDLFIKNKEGQQVVMKFDDLKTQFAANGIELYAFKDKREVFNFVYQRGNRNNGVIWLEDSVMSDGLSNNFSKVYRYLINSKLITNKTLKESLMIADNRDNEGINFSQKSKKDIHDLLRINEEIKTISDIQKDFFEYREELNVYKAKTKNLAELVFLFNSRYSSTLTELEMQALKSKQELDKTQFELNEKLIPKKQKLDREIGGSEVELKQISEKQGELQQQITEINAYEGVQFLNQQLVNFDKIRKETEINLTRVESFTVKQIQNKIADLKAAISKIEAQVKGYSNQLIHKITANQKDKEVLNFILSTDFSSQPADLIEKKITKLGSLMKLFDGEITLPKGLKGSPIDSIEDLKDKLAALKKERDEYEKLMPVAVDFENAQKKLEEVKEQIEEAKMKIARLKTKPAFDKELTKQNQLFKTISEKKEQLEKDLKTLNAEITKKSNSITVLTETKDELNRRIGELKVWKEEVEKINIVPVKVESKDTLNVIYSKLHMVTTDREHVKNNKDRAFDNLKYRIKSTESDEDNFIKFIEDEIACLEEKQKSIDTILQAISTQFANPAYTLLKRYSEFKEYIDTKFNNKLAQIKISDIESLKIVLNETTRVMEDLRKISSIQEFAPQARLDFDQSDNLKTLNAYLDSGKKIDFEELFDIELQLTKGGNEKIVDLKEQVESTGTDIMIRLVIIMSVINRLAIDDTNNKVTITIDEIARVDGKNRLELFRFCKEHNFIPVCTSTEETILDGFDKYILMFRPQKGKKVNINEGYPNVMTQDKAEVNEEV